MDAHSRKPRGIRSASQTRSNPPRGPDSTHHDVDAGSEMEEQPRNPRRSISQMRRNPPQVMESQHDGQPRNSRRRSTSLIRTNAPRAPEDRLDGVVQTIKTDRNGKRFGFIRPSTALQHPYASRDVFFMLDKVQGNEPTIGEAVKFVLYSTQPERPSARNVWTGSASTMDTRNGPLSASSQSIVSLVGDNGSSQNSQWSPESSDDELDKSHSANSQSRIPKKPVKLSDQMCFDFVSDAHSLGEIVTIRDDIGFLRPRSKLPEGYSVSKDVFFKVQAVRNVCVPLKLGDILRFTLSTRDKSRPMAMSISVFHFNNRNNTEISQILDSIHSILEEPIENDNPDGCKSKSGYLVDLLSCTALWRCLGNQCTSQFMHPLLQSLLQLHKHAKGMKHSFKLVLTSIMDSKLFNPWTGPAKTYFEHSEKHDPLKLMDVFYEFFLLVLKYAAEKSRIVAALLHHTVDKSCSPMSRESFLYAAFREVSRCVSDDCTDLSWEDVTLTPNTGELLSAPDSEYMALSPVKETYESTDQYFDTYFRLLRADCFDALRKGIQALLNGNLNPRDMNVYLHVSLAAIQLTETDSGINIVLQIEPMKEVKNWLTCSNLMFGNLLCISPSGNFRDAIWATVSNRDPQLLKTKKLICAELCTPCNTMSDSEAAIILAHNNGKMIMVESPTYYRAYHPVLTALQTAAINSMPFQEELIHGKCSAQPPPYVTNIDVIANLKATKAPTLDPYQSKAFDHVFQHRVACVQGPPGTGKTYIGVKIVETLLAYEQRPQTPILILTYKNHALDEFLKSIAQTVPLDHIVRVGGRCQDAALEKCNLQELCRSTKRNVSLTKSIMDTKDELSEVKRKLDNAVKCLGKSRIVTVETLLTYMQQHHLASLLRGFHKQSDTEEMAEIIHDLQTNGCDKKHEGLLAKAYKHWCPPESFIKEAENAHSSMLNFSLQDSDNISPSERKPTNQKEVEESLFDEKDIETLEKERMSGMKNKSIKLENIHLFAESSDLKPIVQLFSIGHQFMSRLPLAQFLNISDIWTLNKRQRLQFLQCLLVQQAKDASETFSSTLHYYQELCEKKSELENQHKINILASKKIIGMTVTGASIHHKLIEHTQPAIMIVEEAAEILEAQLLASLGSWVQHLILIGDHQQLRPNVESYTLVKTHRFDISMMERLILNKIKFATLNLQNRMRPEFAELLKDIYPQLESNLSRVGGHDKLKCMEKSMFFWEHTDPEVSGRSYTNKPEADRAVNLAVFLIQQGILPEHITILAAYQGQVGLLRRKLKEAEALWSYFFPQHWTDGTTTTDSKNHPVNIFTIDMYQGDENEVVIVSLVRSNDKGSVGFLRTINRRCVSQSRAKRGMYFLGNAETLTQIRHWQRLHSTMKQQNCTGDSITLTCVKHPSSKVNAQAADDIPIAKTFCKVRCNALLDCNKHLCEKFCQPPHKHNECKEDCIEIMSCEMHLCLKPCYPFHSHDNCKEEVEYFRSSCGHKQTKQCSANADNLKCQFGVSFTFLTCKHLGERKCFQDESIFRCPQPCSKKLMNCGHLCSRKCGEPCEENDCPVCKEIQFQRELMKLKEEKRLREEARNVAQKELSELEKQQHVIKVTELLDDEENAAEFAKIQKFIQLSFPSPADHEVDVKKITKVIHVAAKTLWLKEKIDLYDPQVTDLKILQEKTDVVSKIVKDNFKIGYSSNKRYGRGVYTSSHLNDVQRAGASGDGNTFLALIVDVLIGKPKTVGATSNVFLTSLEELKCDSIYNRGTAIDNRYVADEFAVKNRGAVLPLYLVEYSIKSIEMQCNVYESKCLAGEITSLQKYTITPSREVDVNDPLQQEFRIAESQFHRQRSATEQTKFKKLEFNTLQCEITSIDYYVNPTNLKAFKQTEVEMNDKYGRGSSESKSIFAFHGTKKENVHGIIEDNFNLDKLAQGSGDKGWYGAGIYLSEFPQTSLVYGDALILCKVLPGKSCDIPPEKKDEGMSLLPGFDSHRVNRQEGGCGEELVLFNNRQVYPCYVINFKNQPDKQKGKPTKKKGK